MNHLINRLDIPQRNTSPCLINAKCGHLQKPPHRQLHEFTMSGIAVI